MKWDSESMQRRALVDRFAWWSMVLGAPAGVVIGVVVVWAMGGL